MDMICRGADGNPPLIIAKAYKETDFVKFLQTGNALGDRALKLMSDMCRKRFYPLIGGGNKIYLLLAEALMAWTQKQWHFIPY